MCKLFIVSGPSGAGKTVLCDALLKKHKQFTYSISTTTRLPRGDEKEGEEYTFTTVEDFKARIDGGEFLEWAEVHGNYYGTPKKNITDALAQGQAVLLNIDVVGARKLKEQSLEAVYIFISPPSLEVLEARLRLRKLDTEDSLKRRLKNARLEIERNGWYDFVIINDELEHAVNNFEQTLLSSLKTEREQ